MRPQNTKKEGGEEKKLNLIQASKVATFTALLLFLYSQYTQDHMTNNKEKEKSDKKYKLLFVCLGNICRSPAAEEIMRRIISQDGKEADYTLDSAGLYGGHAGSLPDARMRAHAARRGYLLEHKSRKIQERDFETFDYIFAMDDSNYDALRKMAPTVEDTMKVHCMSDYLQHYLSDCIPDPYYGGASGFENVLNLLEDACDGVYKKLKNGDEL